MIDNTNLAQGLVGGLLLARGENAPKAGMRAGLLMGVAGGFNPVGVLLAQTTIRSQLRADEAAAPITPPPSGQPNPPPASASPPAQPPAPAAPDNKQVLAEMEKLKNAFGEEIGKVLGVLERISAQLADRPAAQPRQAK